MEYCGPHDRAFCSSACSIVHPSYPIPSTGRCVCDVVSQLSCLFRPTGWLLHFGKFSLERSRAHEDAEVILRTGYLRYTLWWRNRAWGWAHRRAALSKLPPLALRGWTHAHRPTSWPGPPILMREGGLVLEAHCLIGCSPCKRGAVGASV